LSSSPGDEIADVAGKIGTGISDAMKNVDFTVSWDHRFVAALILMIRKFFRRLWKVVAVFLTPSGIRGLTDTKCHANNP
jgi:hypothetical protein